MPDDRLLPAAQVRVAVHSAPSASPSARRIPRGKGFAIFRGFAPLVIVALILVLFFGGTGGILVIVTVAALTAIVAVLVQRDKFRSRRLYSSGPDDWMSRAAFYVGPFDHSGLPGAAGFARRHTATGRYPEIRLLVTKVHVHRRGVPIWRR